MSLARDVTTVGGATLLSRLLGFIRDVGIAAVLGAGVLSDAFFAALQIPNLFRRLLAEGALNSAFVPMWLRIKEQEGAGGARRFGEAVLGTLVLSLGAIALLCILFAPAIVHVLAPGFGDPVERLPLAVEFVRLSVPYVAVAGLVAVAAAILNAEGRVGAAAFGLVIFNVVMVAAVAAVLVFGAGASATVGAILSGSIVAAGICQFILVGGALLWLREPPLTPRFTRSPDVRRFFLLMVPGVLAGGVPQLKLMAGAMVASQSQAAVSWLYYANRLYELPLGVVSIAIAAVMVPVIAASVRAADAGRDRAGAIARLRDRAWRWRCRPPSRSRCWRKRSPADCSSAAPSVRATPPPWPRRWRRSAPACPATRWKRCSAPSRSRTRTRARRCSPRSPGWRPR